MSSMLSLSVLLDQWFKSIIKKLVNKENVIISTCLERNFNHLNINLSNVKTTTMNSISTKNKRTLCSEQGSF